MIVAHTPDADDAFMFYAMVSGKVKTRLKIEHLIEDIETLNRMAFEGKLDVTALSVHAYAYIDDKYRILSAGASVGDGYGPIVVAKKDMELEGKRIAIPGKYTTATLLLKLALDDFDAVEMRFDRIIDAVKMEKVDAGLLIHEGQITFEMHNLVKVLDLWEFWHERTGLPLPLGVNVIRRDIPDDDQREFLRVMKDSIKYALENVDEAINYAMKYSRGMNKELVKRFATMYVNEYTYEMPINVVKAMEKLFEMAEKRKILKKPKLDILF
ncbi:MqnA/MqnD/SBP family protein [Archaeoglobus sp.]